MDSVKQTTAKSQALTALQKLQYEHWKILNACHICGRTAGKHKKMDRITLTESTYGTSLQNCQHGLKVCDLCRSQDIIKKKYSKAEKKALKKARVKVLKAERRERTIREVATPQS